MHVLGNGDQQGDKGANFGVDSSAEPLLGEREADGDKTVHGVNANDPDSHIPTDIEEELLQLTGQRVDVLKHHKLAGLQPFRNNPKKQEGGISDRHDNEVDGGCCCCDVLGLGEAEDLDHQDIA